MITRIEALRFRSLRYVAQPLCRFHVLVGPNASGKTTFLDVPSFLGQLVARGLESAIETRTTNFEDLLWQRRGTAFELAIEATIPAERRVTSAVYDTVRYEVSIGQPGGEIAILAEKVLLKMADAASDDDSARLLFPVEPEEPRTILTSKAARGTKTVVNKLLDRNDNFYDETGKGWDHAFKLGPRKSALANLPEDESRFPVATWLKALLGDGIEQIVLNSLLMRRASPPGQPRGFKPDGSNLPWVLADLEKRSPQRYEQWLQHVRTALPDLQSITTIERADDRHRYVVVVYRGGLRVPSWMVSDGTLRLLALTLPAYLTDLRGVYLIEEPENGVHPGAVETILQSLTSVYDAQVLLASHSPVVLGAAAASDVLCFAKTPEGATDIVAGSRHPALRDWKGEINLGVLFASGVLG